MFHGASTSDRSVCDGSSLGVPSSCFPTNYLVRGTHDMFRSASKFKQSIGS